MHMSFSLQNYVENTAPHNAGSSFTGSTINLAKPSCMELFILQLKIMRMHPPQVQMEAPKDQLV